MGTTEGATDGRPTASLEEFHAAVGAPASASSWHRVEQSDVDAFARATGDNAFIHIDPIRAARTRFRSTIAHGLYTLSLLPQMLAESTPILAGTRMGVNYGFDRVRFMTPVPVGRRVRGLFGLAGVEARERGLWIVTYDVTVELEDAAKPALTARWLLGRWLDGP